MRKTFFSPGAKLYLHRKSPLLSGDCNTCGVLHCEEKVFPLTRTKSQDVGLDTKNLGSFIFNITIMKYLPLCSNASEDEYSASLDFKNPNVTAITENAQLFGFLDSRSASVKLKMLKPEECGSDFTCEVQRLDSQGRRTFLSTSTLLQRQRDNHMGCEILTPTATPKPLAKEMQTELEWVLNFLHLQKKNTDKLLSIQNNTDGKNDSAVKNTRTQSHSFRNRKDDDDYRNEDVFEQQLSILIRELTFALENTAVIYPRGKGGLMKPYLCDILTDAGGWIVIQRHLSFETDFYPPWDVYKKGFGILHKDFWLGNELLHILTRRSI
ncbi:ficolin-2 [Plakobranchus ocellatus]|uniref:Ficolin-2 n=1 Tax=Plakobranchus ocellatus TaxID=259542 RepID=A0AAV4CRM4_9GAST|nr:ficolin-2 [Plakobranchus ocellatus]